MVITIIPYWFSRVPRYELTTFKMGFLGFYLVLYMGKDYVEI
jgi:hypothetical protein